MQILPFKHNITWFKIALVIKTQKTDNAPSSLKCHTTKTSFSISNVYLQNSRVESIISTFPEQKKYLRILKDYTVGFA